VAPPAPKGVGGGRGGQKGHGYILTRPSDFGPYLGHLGLVFQGKFPFKGWGTCGVGSQKGPFLVSTDVYMVVVLFSM